MAVEADGKIGETIVVVISCRACDCVSARVKSCGFGDVGKVSVTGIAIERHASLRAAVGNEDVGVTVAVKVKDTRSRRKKS